MCTQPTLGIFKPDLLDPKNREAFSETFQRMIASNMVLENILKPVKLTRAAVEQLYEEHRGKPFFAGLVDFMTSGPVYVGIVNTRTPYCAAASWRGLIQSIRAEYAAPDCGPRNLLHGSDSHDSAQREIAIFFHDDGTLKSSVIQPQDEHPSEPASTSTSTNPASSAEDSAAASASEPDGSEEH